MEALLELSGNVGTEVETKVTRGGWPTASFRVACTPRQRRGGEWGDAETIWLTVTCFRGLAENVLASVTKGDPVLVSGKLRLSSWEDEHGERRERLVLEATTVGHDLTRGTSTFKRFERPVSEDDTDEAYRELIQSVEREQPAAAGG